MSLDSNHKLIIACLYYSNPCGSCSPIAVICSCKAYAFAPGWDAEPQNFLNTHGGTTAGHLSALNVGFRAVEMFSKLCSSLANELQNSWFLALMPSNLLVFL